MVYKYCLVNLARFNNSFITTILKPFLYIIIQLIRENGHSFFFEKLLYMVNETIYNITIFSNTTKDDYYYLMLHSCIIFKLIHYSFYL